MIVLVLGRFQPLHLGHVFMMERAASAASRLIIGIGSSNRHGTMDNPFSADERERMIRESLLIPVPYDIRRIPDFDDNDHWIGWIRDNIAFDVFMTNSPRERELFEKAGLKVAELPFLRRSEYWATEIRHRIIGGGDYRSLLPEGTLKVLADVGGQERIRDLGSG
jgi:nicotinamide-nucleotide adenylyltransferase